MGERAIISGWLKPVHGDLGKAYCLACKRELKAKRSVLQSHANSEGHKCKIKQLRDPQMRTLEQVTNVQAPVLQKQIKEGELKLVGFIAEHNLSFSVMDHLSDVLTSICPDSQVAAGIKCKQTKTTGIVRNILGPQFHDMIVCSLKQTKFSLLIDESTDIAAAKQLCMVVRCYDDASSKVVSNHYALIDVPRADAATLFDSIKTQFETDQIPLLNLIGFASDAANVMVGMHNSTSVQSKLLAINPYLFVMTCICHSVHLVASYPCATLPRQTEDFVRDVYSYFNHSAKRLADYKEFQDFTNTKPHKLLRACQTRWLSLQQCVRRIVEQWEALSAYFARASQEDRLIQAERIHNCLSNPHFKMFFYFLDFILPKFTDFNKLYQSKSPNLHLLHKHVQLLYKELLSYYMQPTYIRSSNLSDVDPEAQRSMLQLSEIYLGAAVAQELIKPAILNNRSLVENFLSRCRDFYVTAAKEVKKRFPISNFTIQQLQVIDPACSHREFPFLVPLAQKFPNLVPQGNVQQLDNEWRRMAFIELPFTHDGMAVDEYWGKMATITDGAEQQQFASLSAFMKGLLALPHANADTERIFSQINLIKSKTRNKLKTQTVSALLATKEGIVDCTKFSPNKKLDAIINYL